MVVRFGGACLADRAARLWPHASAAEARPRSILVLDQSDLRGPFYSQVYAAILHQVEDDRQPHTTVYGESLDLGRFKGEAYEASLEQHIKTKYRDKPIGVVVAIGAVTLELVAALARRAVAGGRSYLRWSTSPSFERLRPPPDVTGHIAGVRLADVDQGGAGSGPEARQHRAWSAGAWEQQVIFGNWKNELAAAAGLRVDRPDRPDDDDHPRSRGRCAARADARSSTPRCMATARGLSIRQHGAWP